MVEDIRKLKLQIEECSGLDRQIAIVLKEINKMKRQLGFMESEMDLARGKINDLNKVSVDNILHTILHDREKLLENEQGRLEEAREEIVEIHKRLPILESELAILEQRQRGFAQLEAEYKRLLEEKCTLMKVKDAGVRKTIEDLENELQSMKCRQYELENKVKKFTGAKECILLVIEKLIEVEDVLKHRRNNTYLDIDGVVLKSLEVVIKEMNGVNAILREVIDNYQHVQIVEANMFYKMSEYVSEAISRDRKTKEIVEDGLLKSNELLNFVEVEYNAACKEQARCIWEICEEEKALVEFIEEYDINS